MQQNINSECLICFSSLKENARKLNCDCNYMYHNECIELWLKNNNKCPICKKNNMINVNTQNQNIFNSPLNVPLTFWFNSGIQLPLPLISLQYSQAHIDVSSVNLFNTTLNQST